MVNSTGLSPTIAWNNKVVHQSESEKSITCRSWEVFQEHQFPHGWIWFHFTIHNQQVNFVTVLKFWSLFSFPRPCFLITPWDLDIFLKKNLRLPLDFSFSVSEIYEYVLTSIHWFLVNVVDCLILWLTALYDKYRKAIFEFVVPTYYSSIFKPEFKEKWNSFRLLYFAHKNNYK